MQSIFIHAEVDNDVTTCGVSRYHARKAGGTILPPAAVVLETARADWFHALFTTEVAIMYFFLDFLS